MSLFTDLYIYISSKLLWSLSLQGKEHSKAPDIQLSSHSELNILENDKHIPFVLPFLLAVTKILNNVTIVSTTTKNLPKKDQ